MNIIKQIKTITVLGLFLGINTVIYAQEYPFSSDYGFNPYMINSAYSGLLRTGQVDASYSIMTTETTGSPRTLSLSGVLPFHKNNFALGASLISDRVGVTSVNTAKVSYAYRLNFLEESDLPEGLLYRKGRLLEHSLSFGIDAGIRFFNDELLRLGMGDDPRLSQNISGKIATIGVSAMYNQSNFFIGFTAENLLSDKLSKDDNLLYIEQPFYAYAGYRFYIDKEHMVITPNIMLRHNFRTPIIVDYNIKMNYRRNFEVILSYRNVGALSAGVGVKVFEDFRVMYVFNKYMKVNYFDNSHGFMISYLPRIR